MKSSRLTYYLLALLLCAGVFFLSYIGSGVSVLSQMTLSTHAGESEPAEPEIECIDKKDQLEGSAICVKNGN